MVRRLGALVILLVAASTTGHAIQGQQAPAATALSAAAPAPDVLDLTGSWVGTIIVPEKGKRTLGAFQVVLKHSGETLTGTAGSSTKSQTAFTNGHIQSTQFGTSITFDVEGQDVVMQFQLRPADGMLRGVGRLPGVTATASVELRRVDVNARAKASNISGTWIGTFGVMDAQQVVHVVFEQSGATVTGTAGPHAYTQMPITKGRIVTTEAGTTVSFQLEMAAEQVVMAFELALTDTGLKGTITASQHGEQVSGPVELKPVK